jgi:hypothetical protein
VLQGLRLQGLATETETWGTTYRRVGGWAATKGSTRPLARGVYSTNSNCPSQALCCRAGLGPGLPPAWPPENSRSCPLLVPTVHTAQPSCCTCTSWYSVLHITCNVVTRPFLSAAHKTDQEASNLWLLVSPFLFSLCFFSLRSSVRQAWFCISVSRSSSRSHTASLRISMQAFLQAASRSAWSY